jgi:membrane fusion protein, multidrug efflux system
MRTRIRSLPFIVLTAAVALTGCGGARSSAPEDSSAAGALGPRKVRTAPAVLRDFQPTLLATGTLVPRRRADVRALVDGRLDSVPVDIGTRVRQGQLLFEVRTVDYRIALQQAEANLARAEATVRDREREMARMEGLLGEGSATQQMRDQAETALAEAGAFLKQAAAARDMARQALEDATTASPYDGVVTARYLQRGEFVGRGDPVVEIMDLSTLDAEMEIPERYAGELAVGIPAELTVRSLRQPVEGKVTAVNPKVDVLTRTFRIKVGVDNRDGRLQAGLFVSAGFRLAVQTAQVAVPAEALIRDEGRTTVWVVEAGVARQRRVTEGANLNGFVQILDGVREGETVIVSGMGGLVEGAEVEATGT